MNFAIRLADEDFSFLADRMSRWVDGVLGRDYHSYRPGQTWSPPINFYEDASCFYLVADLAGIDPEAIDLRVEKKRLILRGERLSPRPSQTAGAHDSDPADKTGGELRVYHMEIDHGQFMREINLPEEIAPGGIEASYRSGFLWVKMPKK